MSLDDDLEDLATAAVSDWPEISFSGQLDAAIRDLYRTHLLFPQFWTQEEHGYLPQSEDAAEMIAEARKEAVYELDASIAYLAEDLTQKAIHTAADERHSTTPAQPSVSHHRDW